MKTNARKKKKPVAAVALAEDHDIPQWMRDREITRKQKRARENAEYKPGPMRAGMTERGAMPIQPTPDQRRKPRAIINRAALRRVFREECGFAGLVFEKKKMPRGTIPTLMRYVDRIVRDNVRAFAVKVMTPPTTETTEPLPIV